MNKLKIAIQGKGRLNNASVDFLRAQGLSFQMKDSLLVSCDNRAVDILCVRDDDIPQYVACGAADYGIVGENIVLEKGNPSRILQRLNFGRCTVMIAVPEGSSIKTVEDLEGARIATSYPSILAKFLQEKGINAAIINIKGSVEVAPHLNLADAICDITQTGKTLKENGLIPLTTILESQALLISASSNTFQL